MMRPRPGTRGCGPRARACTAEKARITERYVLMAEPDHILLRPLPNRMRGQRPFAFPFFYIAPNDPKYQAIARRFVGDVSLKEVCRCEPRNL